MVLSDPIAGHDAVRIPPVTVPPRVHTGTAVLLWQARGSSRWTLDDEPAALTEAHALWIPRGVVHALTVDEDSVLLPLHVRARPAPGALTVPTWIAVDGELRTVILAALQVQTSIIRPDVDLERRLVRLIQERAVPPSGLPMPVSSSAHAIAAILRADPADDRPVAELALAHHVSARTVERAFSAETGMTLQEWRARRRMEVAGELLRHEGSAGIVAISVGYRNVSSFRRAFKRHFGVTPGEYSRSFRLPS